MHCFLCLFTYGVRIDVAARASRMRLELGGLGGADEGEGGGGTVGADSGDGVEVACAHLALVLRRRVPTRLRSDLRLHQQMTPSVA